MKLHKIWRKTFWSKAVFQFQLSVSQVFSPGNRLKFFLFNFHFKLNSPVFGFTNFKNRVFFSKVVSELKKKLHRS